LPTTSGTSAACSKDSSPMLLAFSLDREPSSVSTTATGGLPCLLPRSLESYESCGIAGAPVRLPSAQRYLSTFSTCSCPVCQRGRAAFDCVERQQPRGEAGRR